MNVYQTHTESKIAELITPPLIDMGYEVVRIRLGGGAFRKKLQLMLDRKDGTPLLLEDCEKASKYISVLLDVEDPIESEYILEVSSPGLERPLTRKEDFKKHQNKMVKIQTKFAINGQRNFIGAIGEADDKVLKLHTKNPEATVNIEFANIHESRLTGEENFINPNKTRRKKNG